MSSDFIKREEFTSEVRGLREDIKDCSITIAKSIESNMNRLADEIKETEKDWRHRTNELSGQLNVVFLKQAIQEKQIEAIAAGPEDMKDVMSHGFDGINDRLDTANGRLYKHEAEIASLKQQVLASPATVEVSRKAKIAVLTGGGISLLAVIHAIAEMVRTIGPDILKFFAR